MLRGANLNCVGRCAVANRSLFSELVRGSQVSFRALARIFQSSAQPLYPRRARVQPPFRRKVLFEMLEQRILLSGDPLASVTDGQLSAQFGDGADSVVMSQIGDAGEDGSIIIDMTYGGTTQQYAGVRSIVLDGGAGDDSFQFMGVTADVHLFGGGGDDHLIGGLGNLEWTVDGVNQGRAGRVEFSGIENLQGAADNADTFVFAEGGHLDGSIAGGAGGYDTLVLGGYAIPAISRHDERKP